MANKIKLKKEVAELQRLFHYKNKLNNVLRLKNEILTEELNSAKALLRVHELRSRLAIAEKIAEQYN